MKYKGENYQMCDAWFLNVNDRIHVFNLKLPDGGKPKNVAHVYTDDLLHYTKCDDILEPFDESVNPDDCNDHGTGCAITNSTNGKHYIYYTMLNMARDQKIGLLTSDDLEHFEYYGEPVLEIDKTLFEEHMQNGTGTDCRDMIIVYDENEKLYYGYFAAMAKSENGPVGAVGVAESRDLIHWGNQSIVYKSRSCGVVEVPDVYELDGKWYLTLLTHSCFGCYGTFCDKNVVSGTIYAVSDSPKGPFVEQPDNVFIGGTYSSGYTCRTFKYKGKLYVIYIDKSEYGWAVSLPKEVKVIDGNLRPCYTNILEKLRTKTTVTKLEKSMLQPESSTVAWKLSNLECVDIENGITIKTNPYSYQYATLTGTIFNSVEAEFNMKIKNGSCGLLIKSDENTCFVMAEPTNKTLTAYGNGLDFALLSRRNFDFETDKQYHIRVIAMEGQLEVYINDVLVIQNGYKTRNKMLLGICVCGESEITGFKAYELEN